MCVSRWHGNTSTRRAGQQALLDEERFVHIFHRLGLLTDADGDGTEPHWTTCELLADGVQDRAVNLVEAAFVNAKHFEALAGSGLGDRAVAADLGEVANTPQKPVGDTGRTP